MANPPDIAPDLTDSAEVTFRDVMEVLFRRRRTIWLVLAVSMVLSILLVLRPRTFTADGTLRVQPGIAGMYRTSPMAALAGESSDKIASETAIMQSRTLFLQVAKELNLVNDPAFWKKSALKQTFSIQDPKTREKLIRQMQKEIRITHNPKDELIHISCTTISPALSSKIVNTLITDYIGYLFQMRYGSTKRASGWLLSQLDDLKQQIEHDQSEIISLQKKLGVIGLNEQNADYLETQSLNSLTKSASDATIDRILAEAKLRYLENSDPNLMEGEISILNPGSAAAGQNSLLQNLRTAQAQAASNYARLLAQYGPNYPDVRQQKAQLDEIKVQVRTEQQRILNQAKVSYEAASANEKMQNEVLRQKTTAAFTSGGEMVRYVLLLHDYESHRALYEGLVGRLREAGITSGLEAGEIDIVDLADLPVIPNPPGPVLLIIGGLLAGLLAGCILAIASDALDSRVTSSEQLSRIIPLPLLAQTPHLDFDKFKPGPGNLPANSVAPSGSGYEEAMQGLRTSILLANPGVAPKLIMVTSSVPAEGKSTTARNLAVAFARHRARVLLIDCDLRRGTQSTALRLDPRRGVSNVLTKQSSLAEAIQQVQGLDNLFAIPAGPNPPNPAILIASTEMSDLLRECAEQFDFVVLDSAPILAISDSLNLGQLAEAVLLVVREGESNRKAVQESYRRMTEAHLPVTGYVMNDIDFRAHSYSYGYAYGSYYANSTEDGQ